MRNAVQRERSDRSHPTPNRRLFSEQRIPLGLRDFVSNPPETSQFHKTHSKGPIKKGREIIEILNSEGIWERRKVKAKAPLAQAKVFKDQKWHSAFIYLRVSTVKWAAYVDYKNKPEDLWSRTSVSALPKRKGKKS